MLIFVLIDAHLKPQGVIHISGIGVTLACIEKPTGIQCYSNLIPKPRYKQKKKKEKTSALGFRILTTIVLHMTFSFFTARGSLYLKAANASRRGGGEKGGWGFGRHRKHGGLAERSTTLEP